MSDESGVNQEKSFSVEIAKGSKAVCKKCNKRCMQGDLRVAKSIPNSSGSRKLKAWHHVDCIFQAFLTQRQSTPRIEKESDVEGWELLTKQDQEYILEKIKMCKKSLEAKAEKGKKTKGKAMVHDISMADENASVSSEGTAKEGLHKDNYFREFRMLVADAAKESKQNEKTEVFRNFFTKGTDGVSFKGDLFLWCKLLLPSVVKRTHHLQSKQLVKIFSRIFRIPEDSINAQLKQGDLGTALQYFFEKNKDIKPASKSRLTMQEVDQFLENLTNSSKEEEHYKLFKSFVKKCTSNDLKVVIRLIKHDLRMSAGTKHVLDGFHSDAYAIFQACKDLKTTIVQCMSIQEVEKVDETQKKTKKSPKRRQSTLSSKNQKKIKIESLIEAEKSEIGLSDSNDKEKKIGLSEVNSNEKEKRKSIPNYFQDMKLYLEKGVSDMHSEWINYFIAYGGTVLNSEQGANATHVLHLLDTISEPTIQCANSAKHVIVEWIKDTVQKEELQDFRPYTVRWKPDHT